MENRVGLTFGEAIEALKKGEKVTRDGWNGKGMYLYLVEGSTVLRRELRAQALINAPKSSTTVRFNAHIDMVAADGSVVVGWLASQTDMLSSDWRVCDGF